MKYTLATQLMHLDGKTPIADGQGAVLTFKGICAYALVQSPDKEPAEKYKCFALAVKLETGQESVDLSAEEVSRLKRLIGEQMPPVVVGRMYDLLDQVAPPA